MFSNLRYSKCVLEGGLDSNGCLGVLGDKLGQEKLQTSVEPSTAIEDRYD